MAIDWSRLDELKDEVDGGDSTQGLERIPAKDDKVPATESSVTFSPDDDPKLHAAKIAVDEYQKLLKGSSDFVLDAAKHIFTTNPLDTAAGIPEAMAELGTGIFGAFAGTIAGADAALTNDEAKNKQILQEEFGHEDAIINLEETSSSAKMYLAIFNEVAEAVTYQPRTDTGKAISGFVQDIFQTFGAWGKDAGSFTSAKGLGPEVSAAVETLVAGTPYIVPPLLAKGRITVGKMKAKTARQKVQVERIEELQKEGQLDVIPELEKVVLPEKMTPADAMQRLGIDPLGTEGIKPSELVELTNKLKEKGQTGAIVLGLDAKGNTTLTNKADANTIRILNQISTKDINFRLVMETTKAKKDPAARANIESMAKKVDTMYEKARADIEAMEAKERRSLLNKLGTGVLDVSIEVKKRLFTQGGELGNKAAMMHDLIAGATPKAQLRFQKWDDKIYSGITKEDFISVNEIIQSRRIIEIDRIKGEGKTKHPGNTTGPQHQARLTILEESMGGEKFRDLWNRSDQYFRATNEVLVDLYTNGLIDKAAFNTMKASVYEPRKFLSKLDPSRQQKLGNQTINVHDSGLHELGRGALKSLEQDSRALLTEYMMRAENRIARNKANKTLHEFAELYPENGWVTNVATKNKPSGKAGKVLIPQGQVRIDTLIDGQVKPMLMDKHMAEQWITQSPQVTANMANLMRITSGSFITRPLATGYNPGFALVNFPRDISHAYLASSEFSNQLPKFGLQMTRDLVVTAKDAWNKDGAFKDFINEGGGMNFLTHQGTETFLTKGIGPQLTPKWRHVKEAMSKLNEFSEIWTRLAIREQALRNGKTSVEATHAARDYLDFSQGGRYAKSFDHAIPYLNASIQAFRTTARSAKRDPAGFATKVAWLQAAAATNWLSNYYSNPEAWSQVSSAERRQNWIITTPLSFIDQQGNNRNLYFKIKKDNTMIMPTGLTEMLLERYHEGRIPDKQMLRMTLESLPVGSQLPMPPTIAATATYLANHDFWTDSKIWKGAEVAPVDERQEAPRRPTPPFYKDVGDWTGLSPMRTEAAVKKLAPQNPYTDLMGMSYKMLTQGLTDFDKSKTTMQILNDTPILRRIIGITHPASREMDEMEPIIHEGNAVREGLNKKIDNIYFRVTQGSLTGGDGTVRSWITAQPPQERERLTKRFEGMRTYDRIMSRHTGAQGVPSRIWWVRSNETDGITRADLFYAKWRDTDGKGRALMERIAGRMSAQGLGYRSDSFNRQLRKNIKFFGRDYYGKGESTEFTPQKRR